MRLKLQVTHQGNTMPFTQRPLANWVSSENTENSLMYLICN